ncbi:uncharacterized protein PG986_001354 [Apiospora aurea]|uniref:Cation-transporting P-type ATPase N-terminal domain-containing protein n=1 Tax=Apiospora aurea TaxID=335848 RepID=A0ABR1QWK8_9PEZI
MSFLRQRNDAGRAPADDDVEARAVSYPGPVSPRHQARPEGQNAATEQGRQSDDVGPTEKGKGELPRNTDLPSSSQKGGGDDLPEYEALQRFITNYDAERRASVASQAGRGRRSKKWWQFWRSSSTPIQAAHPVVKEGQPPSSWLETSIRQGITSHDIETRRKAFGWNDLSAEKENMFAKFLGFFQGPILYVMELAALLAVGLSDRIDFGVIVGILILNAFAGFYQEKQAADVVASLKGDIAMRPTVVRDGQEQQVLARELVPGDIVSEDRIPVVIALTVRNSLTCLQVILVEGQTIPGDCQLIFDYSRPGDYDEFVQLRNEDKFGDERAGDGEPPGGATTDGGNGNAKKDGEEDFDHEHSHYGLPLTACDQSAITGESLAADKYMGDTVFYTTGCKRGKAYAIITTSARCSFVGKTANLVQGTKDRGHFKQVMDSIGTSLLVLAMFWILVAWIGGFFHHIPIATPGLQTLVYYTLVLFIIGVPVGLPVVTTTTLAVGAAFLATQRAIVQKLTAIESLAGVNVLCSDKTGTLTTNKLSIRDPFVTEGQDVNWMMAVAALATRDILRQGWETDKFTPFDPVSKRITCECRLGSDRFVCAKGAPKNVLQLTEADDETRTAYTIKTKDVARRGFRSLGVACKKNDEPRVLLGLLSMFDPPREDTAQTIVEAQALGVPVKRLTGDAIAIAKETCKMLGLGTKVGIGSTPSSLLLPTLNSVRPLRDSATMLQQRGSLTAMTGDGEFLLDRYAQIALCLHLEIYLTTSMIIINETIRPSLIVFVALFADLATVAVAYDNAHVEPRPVEWQLKKIWAISLISGMLLAAGTALDACNPRGQLADLHIWQWICRGTMLLRSGGIIACFGSIQEVLFLQVSLTENWLNFVTRGGKTWPSWQLVLAILGVDALATVFCLFGWLSGSGGGVMRTTPPTAFNNSSNGWANIVTVVIVWVYSIGVIVFIAIIYYLLNRIDWINDLGRKDRHAKDTHMENALVQLNKTGH